MTLNNLIDGVTKMRDAGVNGDAVIYFSDNPRMDGGERVWDNTPIAGVFIQHEPAPDSSENLEEVESVMLISRGVAMALRDDLVTNRVPGDKRDAEVIVDQDQKMVEIRMKIRKDGNERP